MLCFNLSKLGRFETPLNYRFCHFSYHHHHWHNSPFSAKAFFRSFCQLSLFLAAFLQFLSTNLLASSVTLSSKSFHRSSCFGQSGHCFFRFRNNAFFWSRLSALRPTPSNPGGPIGLLLRLGLVCMICGHRPVWHRRPYE